MEVSSTVPPPPTTSPVQIHGRTEADTLKFTVVLKKHARNGPSKPGVTLGFDRFKQLKVVFTVPDDGQNLEELLKKAVSDTHMALMKEHKS